MARVGRGVGKGQISTRPILVDTSLWIRYFQPTGWEELKRELAQLLDRGSLLTCWVVNAELLVGAKNAAAFDRLLGSLRALDAVPLTAEIWEKAARLGHNLRLKGFSVPLPDLLIAQAAATANAELWHADARFDRIGEVCNVKGRSFVEP
jgi:predicted nucleic acid-binding protein